MLKPTSKQNVCFRRRKPFDVDIPFEDNISGEGVEKCHKNKRTGKRNKRKKERKEGSETKPEKSGWKRKKEKWAL